MQLGSSETQIYYHLLDLDDSQKQQYLNELQQSQPELYLQVAPLLASENEEEQLTELLGFSANLATKQEVDLTGEEVSKYRLTHELGRGGMGVVYAALRADETFEQVLSTVYGARFATVDTRHVSALIHPNSGARDALYE